MVRFSRSAVVVRFDVVDSTIAKVCEDGMLNASCTSGTVLMIDEATYKLTALRDCSLENKHVICVVDVETYVERRCAGRRHCNMLIGKDLHRYARQREECMELRTRGEKSFIDVTYSCLNGKHLCCRCCHLCALNFSFATLGGASIEYRL